MCYDMLNETVHRQVFDGGFYRDREVLRSELSVCATDMCNVDDVTCDAVTSRGE